MLRALPIALVAALAAGCGDDLPEPPVVHEAAGVRVTVESSPARIVVERIADGAVMFDGLPGGAAGTPGAPHVAVAFRQATPSIETQVGSFKIEDDRTAPWLGVETFQHVRPVADGIAFELAAGGERIGAGTITVGLVPDSNDAVEVRLEVAAHPWVDVNRTSIASACAPGEHFLGLGGQSFDVDHRGQTVPLWVEEDGITKRPDDSYDGVWFLEGRRHSTHTPMPMMLSSREVATVVDTSARAVFALCSEPDAATGEAIRLEAWEDRMTVRMFVPPATGARATRLARALEGMTAWVGRPEVPPAFAFAPWLDAIFGQDEVRRVAARLRAEDIPVSVIWTEDWRGGNDEGTGYVLEEDWTVDRDLYPDFEALAGELHGDGYKFLVYHNTFLDEEADVFEEALALGHAIHDADGEPYLFTGVKFRDATMLDLSSPEAIAWAKDVYRQAYAIGADGWMADFAEWLPHDAVLDSGESAMTFHNRYPVEWARLNRELIDELAGDGVERLTFLRAAWLGSQPLVQVLWAGDQQTDFSVGDGLPSVIPMGIGLGVTGFPYYGHDIAGYMSQLTEPATKELWLRWCTLGALSPVMRTHHGRDARNNWNWEGDAETVAHLRRWAKLHVQLAAYLQGLAAVDARGRGLPLMRPVALHYPDLEWAWTTTDQYLLGDRILVAPVIEAGAELRDGALPPGRWYPLLAGPAVEGGATIAVDAPVTEIPAFVPAGAILVLYPDELDTLVEAPEVAGTVTPADIGTERELWLFAGYARDTAPGAEIGYDADGTPLSWSGRDPSLPAPSFVLVGETQIPVTTTDGVSAVRVELCAGAPVQFEGGGELQLAAAPGTCATHDVRLRL